MEKHEWSVDDLTHKAERYCATSEHCCYEVRLKLQQWGAEYHQIDSIITHLIKERYIDEERYCQAFAHDKLLYQGWGRIKIQAHLMAKHLPELFIQQALNNLDEIEYYRILNRIIQQRKNDSRERIIRFCMQRGFTYDEINQLLK